MKTTIIQEDRLAEAIDFLKQEIPIAFPTETVYGLGAYAFSKTAIQKVFTIKGRPNDNPLIVHVASYEEAKELAQDLPSEFSLLAKKYWPGPLTLVVTKNSTVPDLVSGGLDSVAIRCPAHPIALRLIQAVGPLAAPSANLSGNPSPTSALDVLEDLQGKIPLIVDGGDCSVGIESTVLSLVGTRLCLLRPGIISQEELESFLNRPIESASHKTPIASPGMKYRHYSPKARVVLAMHVKDLQGAYVLSPKPTGSMRLLNMQNLYKEFRRADRQGVCEVCIDCTEPQAIGPALMNRLVKAAGII